MGFNHCLSGRFVRQVSSVLAGKAGTIAGGTLVKLSAERFYESWAVLLMLIPLVATGHWRPAMTRHCVSDVVLLLLLATSLMDGQHHAQSSDGESESPRSRVAY